MTRSRWEIFATYRVLVLSGAPIAEINSIRKHLSAVKGGRLAQAALSAQQLSLLVSDVPDNTPDALASGRQCPIPRRSKIAIVSSTITICFNQFPKTARELFERHALEETPKSDDPVFQRARWWPILSNQTAIDEASEAAERAGFSFASTTPATIGIMRKPSNTWSRKYVIFARSSLRSVCFQAEKSQ